jgi:hypothetical protein
MWHRCHDVYTTFHEDWYRRYRHSDVDLGGNTYTDTGSKEKDIKKYAKI